jgi:hypothetical protein
VASRLQGKHRKGLSPTLPTLALSEIIVPMLSSPTAIAASPKLLDRVCWYLRAKHYSIRTEEAYVDWIRRYILFHRKRHPDEMGA